MRVRRDKDGGCSPGSLFQFRLDARLQLTTVNFAAAFDKDFPRVTFGDVEAERCAFDVNEVALHPEFPGQANRLAVATLNDPGFCHDARTVLKLVFQNKEVRINGVTAERRRTAAIQDAGARN